MLRYFFLMVQDAESLYTFCVSAGDLLTAFSRITGACRLFVYLKYVTI